MSAKRTAIQIATVVTVLGALLAASSIVAASREATDADVRKARAVVGRYLDGYERHDGRAICAELTRRVRAAIGRGREGGCPGVLTRRSREDEFVPPGRPRVSIRREPTRGSGLVAVLRHRDGSGAALALRRTGGRWLLDEDQTCLTPSCRP